MEAGKHNQKASICWVCNNCSPLKCAWVAEGKAVFEKAIKVKSVKTKADLVRVVRCKYFIPFKRSHYELSAHDASEIAANIIKQAITDWELALKNKNDSDRVDVEEFFKSDWFRNVAEVDGETLLAKLKKKHGLEVKR